MPKKCFVEDEKVSQNDARSETQVCVTDIEQKCKPQDKKNHKCYFEDQNKRYHTEGTNCKIICNEVKQKVHFSVFYIIYVTLIPA